MGKIILFLLQVATGALGVIFIAASIFLLFKKKSKRLAYTLLTVGTIFVLPTIILPLISTGVDTATDESAKGELLRAIEDEDLASVKQMVETDSEINALSEYQSYTPLTYAISQNKPNVVNYLISMKADVNLQGGQYKFTPLMTAISNNRFSVVKLLLENGALVNHKIEGETELHFAVRHTDNMKIVRLLVEYGSNVNARNAYESTPLIVAVSATNRGHPPKVNDTVIRFLLKSGADVNAINQLNKTAFDYASEYKQTKVIETLKQYGGLSAKEIVSSRIDY